jgi:hypothetical protein
MVKILYILWYIWKARNDKKFNNKNWTIWKIHHAANADCQVTRSVLQDVIHSSITEQTSHLTHQNEVHLPGCTNMQEHRRNNIEEDHIPFRTYQHFCRDMPQLPLYRICTPAMLQGLNIYTDASIPPDQTIMVNHNAGLGVFLQSSGPLHNFNVYIQANLAFVSSVFTAEAAALALAAILVRRLNISEANSSPTISNLSPTLTLLLQYNFQDGIPRFILNILRMQAKEDTSGSIRYLETSIELLMS